MAAVLLLAWAMPVSAEAPVPARVEMSVVVEMGGVTVGEGRDVFEHEGGRYRVVSEARTAGVARLLKRVDERRESRGSITAQGLRPARFQQERTGRAPRTAVFDWEHRRLELSEGEDRETVELPDPTLDQTSLPYAFVFTPPPQGGFRVHVTDGRRLPDYELSLVGRERIRTRLGEMDTLHYRKVLRGDDRRGLEFWLSLDHYRLPVRIRVLEKDGTAFDSTVVRLETTGRPTP